MSCSRAYRRKQFPLPNDTDISHIKRRFEKHEKKMRYADDSGKQFAQKSASQYYSTIKRKQENNSLPKAKKQ